MRNRMGLVWKDIKESRLTQAMMAVAATEHFGGTVAVFGVLGVCAVSIAIGVWKERP